MLRQSGLPNARLTGDQDQAPVPGAATDNRVVQLAQGVLSAHQE
jgi:hypothetical protein